MISISKSYEILKTNLKNKNLVFHSIAVAYVMKAVANKLNFDKEKWFITGLLHDIDYEKTKNNPKLHSIVSEQILMDYDVDEDIIYAIKAHTGNVPLKREIDKHLWAIDPLTGLIVAAALMNPDKRISSLKLKSFKKKFKSRSFAKGANRQQIASCSTFGMDLNNFLELSLCVMAEHQAELGFTE